jgi:D-alanyl-lipoteichoic acid acyltransferase DltB (MBOAT superfamily)
VEFNSYVFVFAFLPVVFLGYLAVRNWPVVANCLLVAASFVFYSYVVIWYSIPLVISAVVDYVVGRRIADSDDPRQRKTFLVASVVVNLSLMSFFKYTGWITGEMAVLLASFGIAFSQVNIPLPPGVSFYTFQTMSYTIDIYRRKFQPSSNFVDYISFVTFFPQLIAGPIERARDLLPQLARKRNIVSAATAASALFLILFGLFQKVVLADNFGGLVDFVFRNLSQGNGELAPGLGLIFAYSFAFQIYCDFAAYSTIARGAARLFSVELSRNFLTPYFAASPSEFWGRWHITLSSWLRDYLYIPLGGNQHGTLLTLRNLTITMFLAGLWHGAGIFFIVWGLYHGLLLVLYRLVPIDTVLSRHFGRAGRFVSIVLFFHLVCLGWIFFRATPEQFAPIVASIAALPGAVLDVFSQHAIYWQQALTAPLELLLVLQSTMWQFIVRNWSFAVLCWGLVLLAVPLWVTDYLGWRRGCEFPDLFDRMSWPVRAAMILVLIYGIVFFARREANEFIYFAF